MAETSLIQTRPTEENHADNHETHNSAVDQQQEEEEEMSWVSALITLLGGVCLPTADVYSDIKFAVTLLTFEPSDDLEFCNSEYPRHNALRQKYAVAVLAPAIISWLFVAYQWFRIEVGLKSKLRTLPFLLLQVYPQWRALRVLYYGKWQKRRQQNPPRSGWQKMKDEWETGIGNLGEL